jgi:excisionase family DNA binding protein
MSDIIPLPPIEAVRAYSISHAALYLNCSIPSIYVLLHGGLLRSVTIGKRRVIPGAALIEFLEGKKPERASDPIDPRMSELGRIGGRAGGLAKARRPSSKGAET